LHYKRKDSIKTLESEAENALNFVPVQEKSFLKCIIAKNINILHINQTKNHYLRNNITASKENSK
jgi:hypothetical protein